MIQHADASKILKLLHSDLARPINYVSLRGNGYIFVCVNHYSCYTWVDSIKNNLMLFKCFKNCILYLIWKRLTLMEWLELEHIIGKN